MLPAHLISVAGMCGIDTTHGPENIAFPIAPLKRNWIIATRLIDSHYTPHNTY